MPEVTWAYFGDLVKERDDKGFLHVKGTATDSSLDLDEQICDPEWLAKAMPEYMRIGNLREMHDKKAVGKAIAMEVVDGRYNLDLKVVNKDAADLVEEDVYTGLSVGIKNARVVKDAGARGGRIVDGKIIEVSLVDRPANPNATLVKRLTLAVNNGGGLQLTKALDESSEIDYELSIEKLEQIAQIVKADDDMEECDTCDGKGKILDGNRECPDCKGKGKVKKCATDEFGWTDEDKAAWDEYRKALYPDLAKKKFSDAQRKQMAKEGKAMPGGGFPIEDVEDLKNAIHAIGRAKDPAAAKAHIKSRARALGHSELIPDTWKMALPVADLFATFAKGVAVQKSQGDADTWVHDPATLEAIESGLICLLITELQEFADGEDERWDVATLSMVLNDFVNWWLNEAYAGETRSPFAPGEDDDMDDLTVAMGVDADLVKRAKSPEATEADKNAVRAEVVKALGLDEIIADYKTVLPILEKSGKKSLGEELAAIREMATPGGPVLLGQQRAVAPEVEKLTIEAQQFRYLSETIQEPGARLEYARMANEAENKIKELIKA